MNQTPRWMFLTVLFCLVAGLSVSCGASDSDNQSNGGADNGAKQVETFTGTWSGTADYFSLTPDGNEELASPSHAITINVDGSGSTVVFGPAGEVPATITGNTLTAETRRETGELVEVTTLSMTVNGDQATGVYSLELSADSQSDAIIMKFNVQRVADR